MFTGEYRHAIDAKGRMAVPARFRAELAGGAVVTRWIDNCLAIFPRQAWDQLAARVAGLPVTDAGARTFSRFLFSGAFEVELDRQGRALVPAGLREQVGLKDEAVVVGMNERIELWEPSRWSDYSAAMTSPETLAQHLEGLGI
jgi:MraZ protein